MTAPVSSSAELLSAIARLNRWATRHAELPIPPAQARLLAQVEESGAVRIGELAKADHCSQPTMTTQVQRLEQMGWVTKLRDESDARAVLTALTPEGRHMLQQVREARAAALAPLLDQLSEADREELRHAVDVLQRVLVVARQDDRDDAAGNEKEQ